MTIEIINPQSFELIKLREVEQKYSPINPESLDIFRERSRPIEQYYLSKIDEPFSLRLREEASENGLIYTATLKDRGFLSQDGLDRLEIETKISPKLYEYYKSPELPCVKKLRTKISDFISIDYFEDGHIQIESENSHSWQQFRNFAGDNFIDITNNPSSSNELRANQILLKNGESNIPVTELHPDNIVRDILSGLERQKISVVRICGRSGSGKSTLTRQIQHKLNELAIPSDVISTDDYNRGSSWLKSYNYGFGWTEWDHPIVYDTETLAKDILQLYDGKTIPRRIFDFTSEEPINNGEISPVPVIIVEGIYALSHHFDELNTLKYEIPTPIATCIGRRILRDINERPTFSNPNKNLKYILEQAEPMYRKQLSVDSF